MMPKSFDHDELGIDLDRVNALPECQACRKKSDGCLKCPDGTILCGKHYDEWVFRAKFGPRPPAAEFAKDLREGKYRACWDAKLD